MRFILKFAENRPSLEYIFLSYFFENTSEDPLKVVEGRKSQKDVGRWKNRKILERRLFFSVFFLKMLEGPMKVVGRRKSRKNRR